MYCKKCGSALPSFGYICKSCGAMMDSEQIKMQKDFIKERENTRHEVKLMSDQYSTEPIKRDYRKNYENKYLGAIFIVLIVIILIIIAILKVM